IGTSAMHLTPAPRLWAAAATLADGRVLLCGGADATIPSGETRPATADAFLYDPATLEWEPISPMRHARAMHRLVALGDGTVLVIGGADAAFGAAPGAAGEPVAEIERFDPDLDAFTAVGPAPIELGSLPAVAWAPGQGLLAVAGVVGQGGGAEYGIVGLGP
ncbi:MAG TPA: kelch repeat-containing protein, partial [Myxococcota bacterium]|nr:kelch repeat-containing protein [Myxococcota bacterium]